MERYTLLRSSVDNNEISLLAGTLEDAGIPVLIEHISLPHPSSPSLEPVRGFRLMVPSRYSQQALQLSSRSVDSAVFSQEIEPSRKISNM